MNVKLLTEHDLEFLSLTGGYTGPTSLHLSKYHIVGNLMSRLYYHEDVNSHGMFINDASERTILCPALFALIINFGDLKILNHALYKRLLTDETKR